MTVGQQAEKLASNYLIALGFSQIDANVKTRFGEVDLIMQQGDVIVFVEVKYRRHLSHGQPYEAVDRTKLKKIELVIQEYVQKHCLTQPIRLDIVSLSGSIKHPHIDHFENITL